MKVTQRLAIGHNLNVKDLLFADKMGGLVCPSMAIFRTDYEFKNYGEITLLMDKSKIDLRKHPAHNADVFSARFPTCYYKADNKQLDEFSSEVSEAVPELANQHSKVDYHEDSMVKMGFEHVADEYSRDSKVLMAYAREQGLNPRIYRTTHFSGITFIDSMGNQKSIIKQLKALDIRNIKEDSPEYQTLSGLMYELMDRAMQDIAEAHEGTEEEIKAEKAYFMERIGKHYFKEVDGKPHLFFNPLRKMIDHIHKVDKDPNPVDMKKTRERLEKLVSTDKQKEKFKDWLEDKIGDAFHSPHMHVMTRGGARKKLAFTADNVLKAMKGKGNGAEKTIFMGAGSIRSLIAKKFTSYRDITSNIDKLVSENDMMPIQDEMNKRLSDIPDILAPNYMYQTDSFRYRDAVYEELADYAVNRNPRFLESFENIDDETMTQINTYLNDLRDAPTHYFEVKKQAIIDISDFDAAIVPKGTSKEAVQKLKDANVKVTFYNPDVELDRIRVVNQQQDILFGKGMDVTIKPKEEITLKPKEDEPSHSM